MLSLKHVVVIVTLPLSLYTCLVLVRDIEVRARDIYIRSIVQQSLCYWELEVIRNNGTHTVFPLACRCTLYTNGTPHHTRGRQATVPHSFNHRLFQLPAHNTTRVDLWPNLPVSKQGWVWCLLLKQTCCSIVIVPAVLVFTFVFRTARGRFLEICSMPLFRHPRFCVVFWVTQRARVRRLNPLMVGTDCRPVRRAFAIVQTTQSVHCTLSNTQQV